jgi:hypothetical protein
MTIVGRIEFEPNVCFRKEDIVKIKSKRRKYMCHTCTRNCIVKPKDNEKPSICPYRHNQSSVWTLL